MATGQLWLFPPPKPLVERFGDDFFHQIPPSPGVYYFCGRTEGVLYLGKAKICGSGWRVTVWPTRNDCRDARFGFCFWLSGSNGTFVRMKKWRFNGRKCYFACSSRSSTGQTVILRRECISATLHGSLSSRLRNHRSLRRANANILAPIRHNAS